MPQVIARSHQPSQPATPAPHPETVRTAHGLGASRRVSTRVAASRHVLTRVADQTVDIDQHDQHDQHDEHDQPDRGERVLRVALIGPTSRPLAEVAVEVADDLERLARPGIELEYHVTGTGPTAVRTHDDVVDAVAGVVDTAIRLAGTGVDGLIVDCTDDPGVEAASAEVAIPVIGPGAALRDAAERAPGPVRWLSGDELRQIGAREPSTRELVEAIGDARTVVLGGTGWSHLTEHLHRIDASLRVVEPLDVALAACIEAIRRGGRLPPGS